MTNGNKVESTVYNYKGFSFTLPKGCFYDDRSVSWCPWIRVDCYKPVQNKRYYAWVRKLFYVDAVHGRYERGDIRGAIEAATEYNAGLDRFERIINATQAVARGKLYPGMSFINLGGTLYLQAEFEKPGAVVEKFKQPLGLAKDQINVLKFRNAWVAAKEWLEDQQDAFDWLVEQSRDDIAQALSTWESNAQYVRENLVLETVEAPSRY